MGVLELATNSVYTYTFQRFLWLHGVAIMSTVRAVKSSDLQQLLSLCERRKASVGPAILAFLAARDDWAAASRDNVQFGQLLREIIEAQRRHVGEVEARRKRMRKRQRPSALARGLVDAESRLGEIQDLLSQLADRHELAMALVIQAIELGRDLFLGLFHSVEATIRAHGRNARFLLRSNVANQWHQPLPAGSTRDGEIRAAFTSLSKSNPTWNKSCIIRHLASQGVVARNGVHIWLGERRIWDICRDLKTFPQPSRIVDAPACIA